MLTPSKKKTKQRAKEVIVIDDDDDVVFDETAIQFRRKKEPFFVGGYDPGTKHGAVVRVNLVDGRVVEGTPVSLAELKKTGKNPENEPTYGELSHCLRKLAKGRDHRRYFRRVVIENQMKSGKLQTVAVALSTLLGPKATMSSMRSVRSHYGISVSERDMNARSRKARRDQAYQERKRLSLKMVEEGEESPLHEEDLEMMFELASLYWEERAERYGITSKGVLNSRIRKAYSDLVEAAVHALFPGNWSSYVDQELGLHGIMIQKLSPNAPRAHRQRAKALLNLFGVEFNRVESRFLPIHAIRRYVAFATYDLPQKKIQKDRSVAKKPAKKRQRAVVAKKKPRSVFERPVFQQKKLTLASLMPVNHLLPR